MSVRELLRSRPVLPLIEAHRGGAGSGQVTVTALQRTLDLGADFIELDVQFTRDRVGVVLHNFATDRGHMIGDLTLDQLRGEVGDVLRLEDVLAFASDTGARLSLDLKTGHGSSAWWLTELWDGIQRHAVRDQMLVLAWDHRLLGELRGLASDLALRALIKGNLMAFDAFLASTDVDAVSLSYDLIERVDVDAAHERHVAVVMVEMWRLDVTRALEVGADVVSWKSVADVRDALKPSAGQTGGLSDVGQQPGASVPYEPFPPSSNSDLGA